MKPPFRLSLVFLSLLIISFCFPSCKKDQPLCKGNCADINIGGTMYNDANGLPLADIPVSVIWFRSGYCIGCTSYKVVSGKSKADGTFKFSAKIDTTFFKNYHLTVRVPADSNYLAKPNQGGGHFIEERFYEFAPAEMQNINFEFYPKTNLTIQLHRTQNDVFDRFTVEASFKAIGAGYFTTGHQNATDSAFTFSTSAEIYTRVVWTKTSGTQQAQRADSIKCSSTNLNKLDIYY